MTRRDQSDLNREIADVAWGIWRCRIELTLTLIIGMLVLAAITLTATLSAAVYAIAGALYWWGRDHIKQRLHAARAMRAWTRAVFDSGACDPPPKKSRRPTPRPRATRVEPRHCGDLLHVKVGRGQSVKALEDRTAELAACLKVREVRIQPNRAKAHRATALLVRHDPFEGQAPIPWPNLNAERLSIWDPIPLGVNEEGETISVSMIERNMLIGGEPGAGKSVALSILAATAAMDPTCKLWLLDGKEVEMAAWGPCAERSVGPDLKQATKVLEQLRDEMAARYVDLKARGLRKIERSENLPVHVVICDELAYYLQSPDKAAGKLIADLLRDLVQRGRAAGIIVVTATQKPGADMVPSALRDLFGFRFALRCNTPQASDTILGQGWASAGWDASQIPGGQRGVGLLLAEDDRPVRLKGFYLADADVQALAERAAARRAEDWHAAAGETIPGGVAA